MKPITADPAQFAHTRLMVARTRLPKGLDVHEELGKGSNNKVFRATMGEDEYVLRAPRRRSDTQQRGSAIWEFRHTLKASQLGVGPKVYDAWCARHAHDGWASGLYVLTERFGNDLDAAFCDDPALRAKAMEHREAIGNSIVACLAKLADELIFVYDLKPSNIMVRLEGEVAVRVIDFGRDFCEWAGCEHDPDSRTPIVTMLRKRVREREGASASSAEVDAIVKHVLFAAMLVQLAATTTHRLVDERDMHRMGAAERRRTNLIAPLAAKLLESMQGRNLALVRHVLRTDEVRGVLRHYLGRRSSGTRRTLRFARGCE